MSTVAFAACLFVSSMYGLKEGGGSLLGERLAFLPSAFLSSGGGACSVLIGWENGSKLKSAMLDLTRQRVFTLFFDLILQSSFALQGILRIIPWRHSGFLICPINVLCPGPPKVVQKTCRCSLFPSMTGLPTRSRSIPLIRFPYKTRPPIAHGWPLCLGL